MVRTIFVDEIHLIILINCFCIFTHIFLGNNTGFEKSMLFLSLVKNVLCMKFRDQTQNGPTTLFGISYRYFVFQLWFIAIHVNLTLSFNFRCSFTVFSGKAKILLVEYVWMILRGLFPCTLKAAFVKDLNCVPTSKELVIKIIKANRNYYDRYLQSVILVCTTSH